MLLKYILFAVFAGGVNIAVLALFLWLQESPLNQAAIGLWKLLPDFAPVKSEKFFLFNATAAGTISGLVLKYILDKNFVFRHETGGKKEEASTFFIYSLMGIITTVIYFVVVFIFDATIQGEWGKYLGAVLGLGIGYSTKFFLDQRFVFR